MAETKGTLLLADDDKSFRRLMGKIVVSLGFKVCGEAVNGQDAVDLYKKIKPDLLLDVNMPKKNGEAALRELKKEFPDAFVIMLTSMTDMDLIEDCFAHGAANYIPKEKTREEIEKILIETWEKFKGH